MPYSFDLEFEVSGIHGYVMMDGHMPSLTQITCSFWMRSSDTVIMELPSLMRWREVTMPSSSLTIMGESFI